MKEHLRLVTNDLFGIANRLKEIDASYFLVFNELLKRYEVHSSDNKGNTLAVVCPYPVADARLLTLVKSTRRHNADILLKSIEENNEKLEKRAEKKKLDDTKDRAKDLLERLKKNGGK